MARFRDMESPEQAYARQVAEGTDRSKEQLRKDARRLADRSRKVAKEPRSKKKAAELAAEATKLRERAKALPKPEPKPKRRWF